MAFAQARFKAGGCVATRGVLPPILKHLINVLHGDSLEPTAIQTLNARCVSFYQLTMTKGRSNENKVVKFTLPQISDEDALNSKILSPLCLTIGSLMKNRFLVWIALFVSLSAICNQRPGVGGKEFILINIGLISLVLVNIYGTVFQSKF